MPYALAHIGKCEKMTVGTESQYIRYAAYDCHSVEIHLHWNVPHLFYVLGPLQFVTAKMTVVNQNLG